MSLKRKSRAKTSFLLQLDEKGIPIVPLDKDGKPDLGRLIRFTRKHVKKWSAEKLAKLYGEEVDGRPVTARWIQAMEKYNEVPTDPKRRLVLATLLGIPPFLFGLSEEFIKAQEEAAILSILKREKSIDIREYRNALESYWKSYYTSTARYAISDVKQRINNLHNTVLYVSINQKGVMQRTLCDYLILMANIARDQRHYEIAIQYLNDAVILARENGHNDLRAAALYRRGYVFFDRWEILQNPRYLTYAIRDYEAARKLDRYVGPQLKGSILLEGGHAYAHIAYTDRERKHAINMIDEGGKIAQQGNAEDIEDNEYFLKLSEYVYHNDRASAFLASGWYNTAYDELLLVKEGTNPNLQRRYAYHNILLARTFVGQKLYPIATTTVENALLIVKSIKSSVHIARIAKIYKDLKDSPYCDSAEVASLGVGLMKAQHLHLFH